ncbi:MAG: hypothetical protein GYB31_12585 [Bacteroidetes bacterium]|nr:hypothetical protein [Bacteroidota bacterium]
MSVFKNIKSLFVVEEGSAPAKPASAKKETATSSSTSTPQVTESKAGAKGKVTGKFMDVLFSAMEKNNLDGFDYLEYKQSLKSLSKMKMDDATRYQSAYAMAETMGATPAKLINSASHYIQVLQKEEEKFESALSKQRHQNISEKEKQVKEMDLLVKQKEDQILKLKKEIEATRKKQETLRKQVKDATAKVETTKNNFIASFNQLVGQIHTDLEAMKQYLK